MTTTIIKQNRIVSVKQETINLKWPERYLSMVAGVKIGLSGLTQVFKKPYTALLKMGAGTYLFNRGMTGHCALYSKLDELAAKPAKISVQSSLIINRPRMAVYNFWRNMNNLPLFMTHLERVNMLDNEHAHWEMKIPTGFTTLNWNSKITMDTPGELISWTSMDDSNIESIGMVMFSDKNDGHGTIVDISISYQAPSGNKLPGLAHVLNPAFKSVLENDINSFKEYMETESLTELIMVEEN